MIVLLFVMVVSTMVMTVVISVALSMAGVSGNGSNDDNQTESTLNLFQKRENIQFYWLKTKEND